MFLTSFTLIFIGEWGDITQIATANYAAKYDDPLSVGIGAALGLWLVSGLAVTVGARLLNRVPVLLLRRVTATHPAGLRHRQCCRRRTGLRLWTGRWVRSSTASYDERTPAGCSVTSRCWRRGPRNQRWHPDAMAAAQDHVAAELVAAGWPVERQPFTAPFRVASNDSADLAARLLRVRGYRGLSGVNLVARRPGRGAPVVVAAHLDTVRHSPGADDNASGVAAVLEVARLLGPTDAPVVLAVLDLEELGLVGASHLARRLTARGTGRGDDRARVGGLLLRPAAAAAGRCSSRLSRALPARSHEGGGRGDFTLVVHRRSSSTAAWTWEAAAAHAGHRCGAAARPAPRRPGSAVSAPSSCRTRVHLSRSDHAAFWRRGVPSLMLTDTASFRNAAYHTEEDLPETLNYAATTQVAVATAATVLSLQSGSGRAQGDTRPGAPR